MINAALVGRDLRFAVGGRALVEAVSLELHAGEFVGLLGCNGAGKSTLLKLLSGDLCPSVGSVRLGERLLADWPRRERARSLAILPQETGVAFPLTAAEVALMGRAPHVQGRESAHDHQVARLALLLTDTAAFAARTFPSLSGGEKQRVQLARVLAQLWIDPAAPLEGPRCLLLDEPTASLDLAQQHRVLEVVRDFSRRGVAALAILHDLNTAARFCDRLLVLHRGRLVAAGTPAEILQPQMLLEAFGIEAHVIPHPERDHPVVIVR